jgi:ABC-type dipeptide/oligopeptide/nickel transport system ATPase component
MKIKRVSYCDKALEWQFEPIEFSNLALLVGVSGVGKTQTLEGIFNLRKIANGESLKGVSWDIQFTVDDIEYKWQGEFGRGYQQLSLFGDEDSEEHPLDNKFEIVNEYLWANEQIIIEREDNIIKFQGEKTPKLSPFKSAIELFNQEEDIAPVQKGFNRIIYSIDQSVNKVYRIPRYLLLKDSLSLEEIQKIDAPTLIKLALVYYHVPQVFQKIKEHFINIFSQVEEIKFEVLKNVKKTIVSDAPQRSIFLKEKGVKHFIPQYRISSGMFKTLMYISEIYLYPEGTVILIDEFENSLGVNCIDIVTDLLMEKRNLQFIITSHHPYIINKIGMEYWKIVTRKGGVVTVKDAKSFNLGKSRHQAFTQLINLEEYTEGIS